MNRTELVNEMMNEWNDIRYQLDFYGKKVKQITRNRGYNMFPYKHIFEIDTKRNNKVLLAFKMKRYADRSNPVVEVNFVMGCPNGGKRLIMLELDTQSQIKIFWVFTAHFFQRYSLRGNLPYLGIDLMKHLIKHTYTIIGNDYEEGKTMILLNEGLGLGVRDNNNDIYVNTFVSDSMLHNTQDVFINVAEDIIEHTRKNNLNLSEYLKKFNEEIEKKQKILAY
jgi:hypothetical protein